MSSIVRCSQLMSTLARSALTGAIRRTGTSAPASTPATQASSSSKQDESIIQNVITKFNETIASDRMGRTFAVIHLYGSEHLVHVGDIIALQKDFPAEIGERVKLEKCLLFGSADFTLVGRPVLNRDLVQVEAVLIEKTMSQTMFEMFHIPRKHGFRRHRFKRVPLSMLRINKISACHPLNSSQAKIN